MLVVMGVILNSPSKVLAVKEPLELQVGSRQAALNGGTLPKLLEDDVPLGEGWAHMLNGDLETGQS